LEETPRAIIKTKPPETKQELLLERFLPFSLVVKEKGTSKGNCDWVIIKKVVVQL